MRILGVSNPKQLFCRHYCDTYKGGNKEGWKFVKEVNNRTTWECNECGKERYGINVATFFKNMPTDDGAREEYLKSPSKFI